MKEAIVGKGPTVQVVDSQVPEPDDDQVLIKVVVAGSNPKDYKLPEMRGVASNSGDDLAGIVEKVGANVVEFKPGDRVAALHEIMMAGGAYAEYSLAPQHTTFHIPKETRFEEAAAIPLAAMTAVVALYQHLALPQPWTLPLPDNKAREIPLVIYGASSSVGFYALQFAQRSNIHPILAVAGRATDHIKSFIDPAKGDVVVDYRDGDEAVVATLKKALEGRPPLRHTLDAVSVGTSSKIIGRLFHEAGDGRTGKFTFVLPGNKEEIPGFVEQTMTLVGTVQKVPESKDLAYVYSRYIARGLREGWFRAQRTEVVPGGLRGIQTGLENLKSGKASAVKYVYRIADTEGVSK
ncbi:chaperonin 10-like protein [Corynascus novoguineensis]|uniref:Chaperonin 10-like protein n=1 Tax=Corynascus novoguineensis TaxID=1126955 RepID=A0AAN7CP79_9PEZI|nr:chaperonin 10-like protein [Corynascus novoguineensis]